MEKKASCFPFQGVGNVRRWIPLSGPSRKRRVECGWTAFGKDMIGARWRAQFGSARHDGSIKHLRPIGVGIEPLTRKADNNDFVCRLCQRTVRKRHCM